MPTARVATAVVLGGIVVAAILWLPAAVLAAGLLLVGFIAVLEWARLAGLSTRAARGVYATLVILLAAAAALLPAASGMAGPLLLAGVCWWALAAGFIVIFQLRGRPRIEHRLLLGLVGMVLFIPALVAICGLYRAAPASLLGLLALVWAADIFAYLGGKAVGRHKFVSRVSPGKTWEGVAAGLLGTLAVAWALSPLFADVPRGLYLCAVAASFVAAIVGDLTESLAKRFSGVKDSGTLLPGHGGAMDRIDSVVAAAPTFALILRSADHT